MEEGATVAPQEGRGGTWTGPTHHARKNRGERQQAEGTTLPATTKDETGEAPIEQPPIISHVPPAESGPTQSFRRKVVSQLTVVTPTITQSQ
jgi:hypothetical protein